MLSGLGGGRCALVGQSSAFPSSGTALSQRAALAELPASQGYRESPGSFCALHSFCRATSTAGRITHARSWESKYTCTLSAARSDVLQTQSSTIHVSWNVVRVVIPPAHTDIYFRRGLSFAVGNGTFGAEGAAEGEWKPVHVRMHITQFWFKFTTWSKVAVEIKWQFGGSFALAGVCTRSYSSRGAVFYLSLTEVHQLLYISGRPGQTGCRRLRPAALLFRRNSPMAPWWATAKHHSSITLLVVLALCWPLFSKLALYLNKLGEWLHSLRVWDAAAWRTLGQPLPSFGVPFGDYYQAASNTTDCFLVKHLLKWFGWLRQHHLILCKTDVSGRIKFSHFWFVSHSVPYLLVLDQVY